MRPGCLLTLLALAACADPAATTDSGPPRPDWGPYPPVWKTIRSSGVDLNGAACLSGHLFVVGAAGTILHRAPGATTFTPQTPPQKATFTAVSFAAGSAKETLGVVVGDHFGMINTRDLGKTWSIAPQCMKEPVDSFGGLHLQSPANGFAMGYRKGDGATVPKYSALGSWHCGPVLAGVRLNAVVRAGSGGWAVGRTAGLIYRADDDGGTWTAHKLPVTETLHGLAFAGKGRALAVGEGGTVLLSSDGAGKVWQRVSTPTQATLRAGLVSAC